MGVSTPLFAFFTLSRSAMHNNHGEAHLVIFYGS
jgi:hypothetical protein